MRLYIFKTFVFILLLSGKLFANTQLFNEGVNLFKIKKFNQAKIKFEQDIVMNPKSEMSYLYLSKIFNKLDNKNLEEQNLNTVILLNPSNEAVSYTHLTLPTSPHV